MGHARRTPKAEVGLAVVSVTPGRASAYLAGAVAGQAGLAVFLTVHAVWILPIWSVVSLGVPVAALGGAAAGWALDELRAVLPRNPIRAWLAVTAGAGLVLSPTLLVAAAGVPMPLPVVDSSAIGPIPPDAFPRLAVQFTVELVGLPVVTAAVLGWVLTRSRRAALATATAGFVFAVGPGHNNPFFFRFMDLAGSLFGVGLMLAIVATASAVLVGLDRWFASAR